MRFAFTTLLLASGLLFLGGCSKYWYQEGKTFDQCRKDLAASQTEAIQHSDAAHANSMAPYNGEFVHESMQQKGYQLVGERQLPASVRRENSPVFGVPGIAGAID